MSATPFIGLTPEGTLQICFTEESLHCFGARLLRGNQRFSDAIYDVYGEEELSRESVVKALQDAQKFLAGEEVSHSAPEFGDTTRKTRKR